MKHHFRDTKEEFLLFILLFVVAFIPRVEYEIMK
jgi:hypothetical protein